MQPTPASADEPAAAVTLQPGLNTVTWIGAEPYAIRNLEGTPISQVHRFDSASGEYLTHLIGDDYATLPELHLLPRVQYLIHADEVYTLTIPNPIDGLDPAEPLRMPSARADPLRFEAYWPNHDSPLEDLILLRSDDQRLSVRTEIAGGVGEVNIWWALDGRINFQGEASDDIELLPGRHDQPRLYASDETGQVAVAELPRVVKLPPFKLAEPMIYGINTYGAEYGWYSDNWPELQDAAARAIKAAGLSHVRISLTVDSIWEGPERTPGLWMTPRLDPFFEVLQRHDLTPLPIAPIWFRAWLTSADITQRNPIYQWYHSNTTPRDLRDMQELSRAFARRWPHLDLYEFGNEMNINGHFLDVDPHAAVAYTKASALGVWYENPDAVVLSASLCCFWLGGVDPGFGVDGDVFLDAMYEAGFGPWHDIAGIHYWDPGSIDRYRAVMARHGYANTPLWNTEDHTGRGSEEDRVDRVLTQLRLTTARDDVHGILIYYFRDSATPSETHPYDHLMGIVGPDLVDGDWDYQTPYFAIQEFLRSLNGG